MLIFIDESGDTGFKFESGSSDFFVMSLVLFEDPKEGERCSDQIDQLKKELGLPPTAEFHFNHNADKTKLAFLQTITAFDFAYFVAVIDKKSPQLGGRVFEQKETFYKYACNLVFSKTMPFIDNATITFDKAGSKEFQTGLRKYLKASNDKSLQLIKNIKQQDSSKTNLLQVADYIAGIHNRMAQGRKECTQFYEIIKKREMYLERYP